MRHCSRLIHFLICRCVHLPTEPKRRNAPTTKQWPKKPDIVLKGPKKNKGDGVVCQSYIDFDGHPNQYVSCHEQCPAIDGYIFECIENDQGAEEWILWLLQVVI